jgi:hypothetical protein
VNLGAARLVLRVRSAADVLDLAAPFCLRDWRAVLPLAGLVLLPAFGGCLVARHFAGWGWPAVWTLAVVLGVACQAPFTVAFGELLFRAPREVRLGPVLGRSARRLPAHLFARLVYRLIDALGLSVVVLPVFTLSVFLVVSEVILLEGAGPFAALGRSGRAARGRGAGAFGVGLVTLLLPAVGLFGGEIVGSTVVSTVLQLGEPFGTLWSDGGSPYALAGFFLTVPLVTSARFLEYVDLRTRKEGWDIQLRFMAIAAGEETGKAGLKVRVKSGESPGGQEAA